MTPQQPASAPASVSVIVCTYRRQRYLPRLFLALSAQSRPPREVLVVDNEVSAETAALVAEWAGRQPVLGLRYLPAPQLGLSHARNVGLQEAKGDLLAFLDDDAAPDPGWVAALESGAKAYPKAGVFAGPVRLDFEEEPPAGFMDEVVGYLHWLGRMELGAADRMMASDEQTYRGPVGANMIVRRLAAEDVPPFPTTLGRQGTSLLSGEEILYVLELERRGWLTVYLHRAGVIHSVPAGRLRPEWFVERSFADGRSMAVTADELRRRHGPKVRPDPVPQLEAKLDGLLAVLRSIRQAGLTFADLPLPGRIDLAAVMGAVMEERRIVGDAAGPLARLAPGSLREFAPQLGAGVPGDWGKWVGGA